MDTRDSSWGFPSRSRPPFSVFTILAWPGSTAGKKKFRQVSSYQNVVSLTETTTPNAWAHISTHLIDQGHVVGLHLLHVDPDVALAVQVILAATTRKKDSAHQSVVNYYTCIYIKCPYLVDIKLSICNRLIWCCLSYLNTCSHLRFSLSSSFIRCM